MLISDFIIFPFHWFCSFLVSLVQELYSQEKYKYRISPVSFPRLKSPLQAGWCSFSQRQSRKADKRGEHSLTQNATKEKKNYWKVEYWVFSYIWSAVLDTDTWKDICLLMTDHLEHFSGTFQKLVVCQSFPLWSLAKVN